MKKIILSIFIFLLFYNNVNGIMCDHSVIKNSSKIKTTILITPENKCTRMEVRISCLGFRYLEIEPSCGWKYYFLEGHVKKDNLDKKITEVYKVKPGRGEYHINNESGKWQKTLVDRKNINDFYYIEGENDLADYKKPVQEIFSFKDLKSTITGGFYIDLNNGIIININVLGILLFIILLIILYKNKTIKHMFLKLCNKKK